MMQRRTAVVLLAALAASTPGASGAATGAGGGNPIRKVVTLMQDMVKEIETEGEKEKELFDKFMCYCQGSSGDLDKAVADAQFQIKSLGSKLESETAEKLQIGQELVAHKADREESQKDLAEATAVRDKEAAEFAATSGDLQSNLQSVTAATKALEAGTGGASLLQVPAMRRLAARLPKLPFADKFDRQDLAAFLQQRSGEYAPASGQIVGMLKTMTDDMQATIADSTKDEETAQATFDSLASSKKQEIDVATEAVETKASRAGNLAVSVVETKDALEDAQEEEVSTKQFIKDLKTQCASKQSEWDERVKMRQAEITAVGEAIAMLSSDDALDLMKKAVPAAAFDQQDSLPGLSLLQQGQRAHALSASRAGAGLRAGTAARARMMMLRVDKLLKHIGDRYPGTPIALLSVQLRTRMRKGMRSGVGGFEAVQKVVDEMINTLSAEQAAEDKQKTWCEGELGKSDAEEKAGEEKKAALEASKDQLTDMMKTVDQEIIDLQDGVKVMDKTAVESTEERKQDHEDFLETVTQSEAAIMLLGKAKNKLNKFYNPSLATAESEEGFVQQPRHHRHHRHHHRHSADAFLQVRSTTVDLDRFLSSSDVAPPPAPNADFGEYKKSDSSSSVLNMIDSIVRDLEKDSQEAAHNEQEAQKDYVEMMTDSAATRAKVSESIIGKNKAKADGAANLANLDDEMSLQKDELMQTMMYASNVHGQCDRPMKDYDGRKEARSGDIEGLKNAKMTLNATPGL